MVTSKCLLVEKKTLNLTAVINTNDETYSEVSQMLSDKITSFFLFFKEDKVAINEKKHIRYFKISIHHYKNMFYI